MKCILLLIISFLCVGLACRGRAVHQPAQYSELAMRIAAVLPQTWGLEESTGQIIISRKEPVRTHGCIGLDLSWLKHPELLREDVEKYGVTRDYKIRLRFGSIVGLEEYARLKASNSQIKVTKSTIIENRQFYEDDAMQSFDRSYRELPEYYDKQSSVYVETTLHPWECIYPGDVARDCERVCQLLDPFFNQYPGADRRRGLSWMGQ